MSVVTFKVLTDFLHAIQHFCHTQKGTLLWMSSSTSKWDPFKEISNFGNKKLHSAELGYCWCCNCEKLHCHEAVSTCPAKDL